MNFKIRLEKKTDEAHVENLTRKAFWKAEKYEKTGLGCDEHYLVHLIRQSEDYIPELNFIVEVEGEIVGNIMYTKARIVTNDEKTVPVILFGPLSVLPEYQKKGIGAALLNHSMAAAQALGYGAILIYGHPSYYPRFGFQEAKNFNITTEGGENFPAFMVKEVIPNYLKDVQGKFYMSSTFNMDPEDAKAYDKQFKNT
jgi:predicted N-acetyltransferase YhbS